METCTSNIHGIHVVYRLLSTLAGDAVVDEVHVFVQIFEKITLTCLSVIYIWNMHHWLNKIL